MLQEGIILFLGLIIGVHIQPLIEDFIKPETRNLGIQTDINTWSVSARDDKSSCVESVVEDEEEEEKSSSVEIQGWWMFN